MREKDKDCLYDFFFQGAAGALGVPGIPVRASEFAYKGLRLLFSYSAGKCFSTTESKRNKFELKPHDRPTWRRPCWRGAARGARATAGGDSGGGSRRAPAAAGRTAIDEGLCGSPQKLIKLTASELWPEKSLTPPSMAQACWLQLRVSARCGHT